MKVGVLGIPLHPFEMSRATFDAAVEAEADSLWVPDHMLGTWHPDLWAEVAPAAGDSDAWYDPFAYAAAIGRDLPTPIGVCVTDGIRRRAPDLVRTALTLHQICGGGFCLGVGSGEAENLVPFGYDFSTPVAQLEQFLGDARSLFGRGLVPHGLSSAGGGLPLARKDIGPPQIWVAGHQPRMLRLTGQFGDGWIPAWPMSPADYGARRQVIARWAQEAGRPAPESAMLISVVVGESRARIAESMERTPLVKLTALSGSARLWAEYGLTHPGGPKSRGLVDLIYHDLDPDHLRALAPTIPTALVERCTFIGNIDEILSRIRDYVDNGLRHIILIDQSAFFTGDPNSGVDAARFTDLIAVLRTL